MEISFNYVQKYRELARLIASFNNKREEFSNVCKIVLKSTKWVECFNKFNYNAFAYFDPFSFLCIINGFGSKKRIELINDFCSIMGKEKLFCDSNEKFSGVSILNYNQRIVVDYRKTFEELKISSEKSWNLFALAAKQEKSEDDYYSMAEIFDDMQRGISRSWDRITHGLSYVDPDSFIALCSPNRRIIKLEEYSGKDALNFSRIHKLERITGSNYFNLCRILKSSNSFGSLAKLSSKAYEIKDIFNGKLREYKSSNYVYDSVSDNDNNCLINKLDEKLKKSFSLEFYFKVKDNQIYKRRSAKIRYDALERSGYKCKVDNNHHSFLSRVTKTNYLETHHLIPMMFQTDPLFQHVNLDVIENIVCLCPNCHQKLHHGIYKDFEGDLVDLYKDKIGELKSVGIYLDLKSFLNLYKNI